jgi:hypothetical protein
MLKSDMIYMFCGNCGNKLINNNCDNCFSNSNALREFEEEDE